MYRAIKTRTLDVGDIRTFEVRFVTKSDRDEEGVHVDVHQHALVSARTGSCNIADVIEQVIFGSGGLCVSLRSRLFTSSDLTTKVTTA